MPWAASGDFKRLYKAVSAVKGALSKLLFPIGTHHLRRFLELIGPTECQSRDVLVCATGMAVSSKSLIFRFVTSFGSSTQNMTHPMRALWRCTSIGGSKTQHVKVCTLELASHLVLSGTSLIG